MKSLVTRSKVSFYILFLWILYILFKANRGIIFHFPILSFELLTPAIMQVALLLLFDKILFKKYSEAIKFTSLVCCILLIYWHYNFYKPGNNILVLFAILPVLLTLIIFLWNKYKNNSKISVLKYFGVILLLFIVNFIMGFLSFFFISHILYNQI